MPAGDGAFGEGFGGFACWRCLERLESFGGFAGWQTAALKAQESHESIIESHCCGLALGCLLGKLPWP